MLGLSSTIVSNEELTGITTTGFDFSRLSFLIFKTLPYLDSIKTEPLPEILWRFLNLKTKYIVKNTIINVATNIISPIHQKLLGSNIKDKSAPIKEEIDKDQFKDMIAFFFFHIFKNIIHHLTSFVINNFLRNNLKKTKCQPLKQIISNN